MYEEENILRRLKREFTLGLIVVIIAFIFYFLF